MKKLHVFFFSLLAPFFLFAQGTDAPSVRLQVEVTGVKPGGGRVYIAIFNDSEGYRRGKPFRTLILEASDSLVRSELEVPSGEYVISVYQDVNGNGTLDANFLGIPREPVGISNYDGKGPPGGFDRQKIRVEAGVSPIPIRLTDI